MIPSGENAATALTKARNALAVPSCQPFAQVDGEKPQLGKAALIQFSQNWFIALSIGFSIARHDVVQQIAVIIFKRSEMIAQEGEAADVPVVSFEGNRCLHQDANRIRHERLPFLEHEAVTTDIRRLRN